VTTSRRRSRAITAGEPAPTLGRGGALRRRYRIIRRRLGAWLLPRLGPPLLRRLARSWRTQSVGREHLDGALKQRGHLMALWHGSMLLGLPEHAGKAWSVLVSPSDDGDLVQPLLERFGYGVVRGSTSQGGARALRALLAELERGGVVVLTPDGPRGPRHAVNPGPAWMAMRTGATVVPCGFACDRAWRLSSWDRFEIPRPGARVVLAYGEPVSAPKGAGEEALRAASEQLRARLLSAEGVARATLAGGQAP